MIESIQRFMFFGKRRWSDKNWHLWPFTFSLNGSYRPLALVLDSGDPERDTHGCHIRVCLIWFTVTMELLPIILPWRRETKYIHNGERFSVFETEPREYGFSLSDGFLQIFYGPQTGNSDTEKNWCTHLPWTEWRHVRYSLYDIDGDHFWTTLDGEQKNYDEQREKEDACPSVSFEFDDYDGERITVRTFINEREWHFGRGWFKWLSLFRRPKIRRSLDLKFSKETGPRKGSWKGGTLGHGIDLLPGELHDVGFRRYCAENRMTFIGEAK